MAIELTKGQKEVGRDIIIRVWGWGTLKNRIAQYEKAIEAFDPTWNA